MNTIPDTMDLEKFLNDCDTLYNSGRLRSPYELLGLVTSIISSPEQIEFSEWMPLIWQEDAEVEAFDTPNQASLVIGHLTAWSNYCSASFALDGHFELPDVLFLDDDGEAVPELSSFARGYLMGHEWLKDVWDEFIPEDDSAESQVLGATLVLMMQCYKSEATAQLNVESDFPNLLLALSEDSTGELTVSSFIQAVGKLGHTLSYLSLSEDFSEDLAVNMPVYNEMKGVGRNDPCPCGSGKKYKKCCLM